MTRTRMPSDWDRDLTKRHETERAFEAALRSTPGVSRVIVRTNATDAPDFVATVEGRRVGIELKSKLQPSSGAVASRRPEVPHCDLFVLDDKAYSEIVERDCLLVVWDMPCRRWLIFSPETLAAAVSEPYERVIHRRERQIKLKRVVDLSAGAEAGATADQAAVAVVAAVDRHC